MPVMWHSTTHAIRRQWEGRLRFSPESHLHDRAGLDVKALVKGIHWPEHGEGQADALIALLCGEAGRVGLA